MEKEAFEEAEKVRKAEEEAVWKEAFFLIFFGTSGAWLRILRNTKM